MITEFQKAVYQVLVAAQTAGGPLEDVAEILPTNMEELDKGGITVGGGDEYYLGGSENQRDLIRAELNINCIVKTTSKKKFATAEEEADQMAKAVRKTIKANLNLTCQDYPNGFTTGKAKIISSSLGYGQHAGTMMAIATVTIEAHYNEEFE